MRVCAFGHVGDGNIHFNLSQPPGADRDAFLAHWHPINERVNQLVTDFGGSIAAEHGVEALAICTVSDDIPSGAALTADERATTFDEMIDVALATAVG